MDGVALAAVLVLAARASAGADEATRTITLAEAVASADRMPELAAARAGERAAAAAVGIARALPDPSVSFTTNSVTAREAVAASLPLPFPGRGSRIAAANADVRAAARGRESARATARHDLRVAWFALAAAEARSRAAADRQARAERNAGAITASFEAGRVARVERVRADAESALARSERVSADEARRAAAAALAALMGVDAQPTPTTEGAEEGPVGEGRLEECLARARAAPDVRRQEALVEAAAARARLARRLRIPTVAVNVGAEWNDPTQPGTNKSVGVTLGVPLAGGAAEAQAVAEHEREVAQLERERRAAGTAAEAAWRSVRGARLRLETVDADLLPAAREAAELARLAYREGKADVFRLLDAERLVSEAAVARADALEAWGSAWAELLRVTAEDER